jgi:hypothetical protein
VGTIREGTTFECADCGHQSSLTSGTVPEKTRKPFKMCFRAVFEISTRRTGISAKDLQRIMGFGSYGTAWTWLHELQRKIHLPGLWQLGYCVFAGAPPACCRWIRDAVGAAEAGGSDLLRGVHFFGTAWSEIGKFHQLRGEGNSATQTQQ